MKAIYVVFGLLLGLPVLLTSCFGLMTYGAFTAGEALVEEFEEGKARRDSWTGGESIRIHSDIHGAKGRLRALKDLKKIRRSRAIVLESYFPLKDVASRGQRSDLKDKSLAKIIFDDWIVGFAEDECAVVLETIATKCEVLRTGTSIVRENFGRAKVILNFVPKAELGTVERERRLTFQEAKVKLGNKKGKGGKYSWKQARKQRAKIYKQAVKKCDRLRRKMKNCAVSLIVINAQRGSKSARFKMYGEGVLSYVKGRKSRSAGS